MSILNILSGTIQPINPLFLEKTLPNVELNGVGLLRSSRYFNIFINIKNNTTSIRYLFSYGNEKE